MWIVELGQALSFWLDHSGAANGSLADDGPREQAQAFSEAGMVWDWKHAVMDADLD